MASGYAVRREDDGTWTVYDRATDMPAVINDSPQIGHSEEDARDVARELDELLGDDDDEELATPRSRSGGTHRSTPLRFGVP